MEKSTGKKDAGMPFSADINVIHGIMKDPDTQLVRLASSMRGHYADAKALEELIARGDPVHYEVFEKTVPQKSGDLQFGISKTYPGTVGGECFMTKGHYHAVAGTGEVYLCLRGEGYMLMKLPGGESACERMVPGTVVYVPPLWGHRSVCTGEEPLATFYVYPAEAGHNYGDIEKEGFPVRVFKRAGKIEIVPSRKG